MFKKNSTLFAATSGVDVAAAAAVAIALATVAGAAACDNGCDENEKESSGDAIWLALGEAALRWLGGCSAERRRVRKYTSAVMGDAKAASPASPVSVDERPCAGRGLK